MDKPLRCFIMCIVVFCCACANSSRGIDVLHFSGSSAPAKFPLQTLYVDGARKGIGKIVAGEPAFVEWWHVELVSDANHNHILDSINSQLLKAGFVRDNSDADSMNQKQSDTYSDLLRIYKFQSEWMLFIDYWDYRHADADTLRFFSGSDLEGYRIRIVNIPDIFNYEPLVNAPASK